MIGKRYAFTIFDNKHVDKRNRNAIAVKNIANSQIGHIPREVAGRMAPLMDRGLVTVEGVMHEGNRKCLHNSIGSSFLKMVY